MRRRPPGSLPLSVVVLLVGGCGAARTVSTADQPESTKSIVSRDARLVDVVELTLDAGSDRYLSLVEAATDECMENAGYAYARRSPAEARGESPNANDEALKRLPEDAQVKWYEALGGVVSVLDGQLTSTGGCFESAQKRVTLNIAFPEVTRRAAELDTGSEKAGDVLYRAIEPDSAAVLMWHSAWPKIGMKP
jgi:hypothetical protein